MCKIHATGGEDRIDLGGFEFYVWPTYRLSRICEPSPEKVAGMIEGRREKREAAGFQVQLCNLANQLVVQSASTQDTSVHGLRVQTERPWGPTTRLFVKSYQHELWALARVVYCQTLQPKGFALGLELLAWTGGWKTSRLDTARIDTLLSLARA